MSSCRGWLRKGALVALCLGSGCSSGGSAVATGDPTVAAAGRPSTVTASAGTSATGDQPLLISSMPVVTGAAGSNAAADCGTLTQQAQVEPASVDIVWIIDGSASMVDEMAAVQQNIANFADVITKAGIDYHVVMLGIADVADMTPLAADAAHYKFVPALVDSNNPLEVLLDQYADYQAFLRPKAALHFVVVTDDESSLEASKFQADMEQRAAKKFVFHAIASESVNGLACTGECGIPVICGGTRPGVEYYALAEATHGQKISICTADWSQVFGALQAAVIASAPLPCDYAIPAPPAGAVLDPGKVNVAYNAQGMPAMTFPHASSEAGCADRVAWFYDQPTAPKQIKMCPAACKSLHGGGTIQIKLGCETVVLN